MTPRLFAALPLLLACGCDRGEPVYPDRPLTLIVPWAAGGGTDRVSRNMAMFLERELGVPVNVVNAVGGAGVTGHSKGLTARPDGATLTMMTVELNMLHWRGFGSVSPELAEPLMSINEDAAALFVATDAPWKNLSELAADIRRKPESLTASGTATGAIWHLGLAGWLVSCDLKPTAVKWIPMNGAAPSLKELVGGGLNLVCCSLPEARTFLDGGQVRCLGVMSAKRAAGYASVPTFREQGFDWELVGWRGLAVPKGTPEPIVARLVEALRRITAGETVVNGKTFPAYMAGEGFNANARGPAEFREFLKTTDARLGALLMHPDFASVRAGGANLLTFPWMLLGAIGLVLAGLAIQRVRTGPGGGGVRALLRSAEPGGLLRASAVPVAVIGFALLSESVGFVLAAGGASLLLMFACGAPLRTGVATVLVFVPALYHLFDHVLRVPLPRGPLCW